MKPDRPAPIWRQEDADYYARVGDVAVCMKCDQPIQVGEAYWLDWATMMCMPTRVFHDSCPRVDTVSSAAAR